MLILNFFLQKLEKSLDEVRCIATDAKTTASEASFKAEESARKLSVWEGHWNKRSEGKFYSKATLIYQYHLNTPRVFTACTLNDAVSFVK